MAVVAGDALQTLDAVGTVTHCDFPAAGPFRTGRRIVHHVGVFAPDQRPRLLAPVDWTGEAETGVPELRRRRHAGLNPGGGRWRAGSLTVLLWRPGEMTVKWRGVMRCDGSRLVQDARRLGRSGTLRRGLLRCHS